MAISKYANISKKTNIIFNLMVQSSHPLINRLTEPLLKFALWLRLHLGYLK